MNVRKLIPAGSPRPASDPRPVPRMNRNRNGWISEVTARSRSVRNRISSRRQTIPVARRSCRNPLSGTATLIASVSGAPVAAAASVVVGVAICYRLRPKRCAMARMASAPVASVSRIVRPV